MKHAKLILPLIMGAVFLNGCSSMSEEECLTADWYTIGFEDGSRGLVASAIGEHRKDCAEYGVAPDLEAYSQGRDRGLLEYCHARRGFTEGRSGTTYQGVCPAETEDDYLAGYSVGRQIHDMEQELGKLKSTFGEAKRELRRNESRTKELEKKVVSDESTEDERKAYLAELRQLRHDREHLEHDLVALDEAILLQSEDIDTVLYSSGFE
jgi:hypothetical protein